MPSISRRSNLLCAGAVGTFFESFTVYVPCAVGTTLTAFASVSAFWFIHYTMPLTPLAELSSANAGNDDAMLAARASAEILAMILL